MAKFQHTPNYSPKSKDLKTLNEITMFNGAVFETH